MRLRRRRVLELFAEVLIALLLVGAVILYAATGPFPWMPTARTWFLVAETGILFWAVLKRFRAHWRRLRFWLTVAALLVGHTVCWVVVLVSVPGWRPIWFLPPLFLEIGLLFWALMSLGFPPGAVRRGHGHAPP